MLVKPSRHRRPFIKHVLSRDYQVSSCEKKHVWIIVFALCSYLSCYVICVILFNCLMMLCYWLTERWPWLCSEPPTTYWMSMYCILPTTWTFKYAITSRLFTLKYTQARQSCDWISYDCITWLTASSSSHLRKCRSKFPNRHYLDKLTSYWEYKWLLSRLKEY